MPEGDKVSLLLDEVLPAAGGNVVGRRAISPALFPSLVPFRPSLAAFLVAAAYLVLAARTTGLGPVPLLLAPAIFVAARAGCPEGGLPARYRRVASAGLPFILFAAFYHWLGWLSRTIAADDVHVFFPYWFDKTVFGAGSFGDQVSINELFALHHRPWVDFVTGLAYLSFLPCVIGFAGYLLLLDPRPAAMYRARRFGWTFLGVNLAGYGTYYLCPVAPPWYVAAQGFGPVDLATHASPAALLRWDAMMGIPYFDGFYAQATEVFGALPSMHCAYPMLLLLFARELRRTRLCAVLAAYELLMCFSAVYLQHHYVTDVIAGILYGAAAYGLGRLVVHLASLTSAQELLGPGDLGPRSPR